MENMQTDLSSHMQAETPSQTPPNSWWGRNWKWVVPVGILTPIVVIGGGLTLIILLVFGMIKSSDPYTDSLAQALANPKVQAALGSPIEAGFFVTGNINVSGSSGDADIAYTITGPNDSGSVYVVAEKSGGQWYYSTMEVQVVATADRIDLLEGP